MNLLNCFSARLHSHAWAHAALNLTRPAGMKCQTASAFLLRVTGGSAERRRQNDKTAAKNRASDAREWQWRGVFNCGVQRKRGRRNELCNPSEESEEAGKVRRKNPVMTALQLLTKPRHRVGYRAQGTYSHTYYARRHAHAQTPVKKMQELAELQGSWKQTVKFVSLCVHQHSLWLRLFVLLPPFSFSLETKCTLIPDPCCAYDTFPSTPRRPLASSTSQRLIFLWWSNTKTAAVHDDFYNYDTHQKSPSQIHIWATEATSPMSCHCIWLPLSFWDLLQGLPWSWWAKALSGITHRPSEVPC